MWQYWLFVLWLEKELSENDVNELIKLTKKEKALFIQIETINYTSPQPSPLEERGQEQIVLKKWYFKKFITPYTAVIDLTKSEDEILTNMKPKGRYNIKLARKKWIEIREVEKNDENIKVYYNLMLETTSRDNFSGNNFDYYKIFLQTLKQSKLLLAYVEDNIIAGWIFTFDKEISIYYYWASTSDRKYRNIMAPYLLQWEAIKIAQNYWSKIYDFLWVAWPNDKNSSLSWVTDFKKKLTKDTRKVSYSYIIINKKIKYKFIIFMKFLKNKLFRK